MIRRDFLKNSLCGVAGLGLQSFGFGIPQSAGLLNESKDLILGHGTHRYKVDLNWGALNAAKYPVRDCHEMVQDSKGRIILLTNHTKNNILVYDKSGVLIEAWGTSYPGAHGLTFSTEGGEEFLYISDNERHEVVKTTLSGKEVMRLSFPQDSGKYESANQYVPTETAIAANGDIYVADGYGQQYILHYNSKGELLNVFGGKGDGEANFGNAHGICIDDRNPMDVHLLITDRMENKLKAFNLDGKFRKSFHYPGAYICRPVIHGNEIYLATIWSGDGSAGTGFISILNEKNQMISAPGGSSPVYENEQLLPMHQAQKIFYQPHDVCVDDDENLYIAQWDSAHTYPIKLNRV